MLARAIVAGASAQIRNMATVGGNLLQRTRCYYFYDDAARCNKRRPARAATRSTASTASTPSSAPRPPASPPIRPTCASRWPHSTPSSISKARTGDAQRPAVDLHRLPGDTPDLETLLEPGELITAVELPPLPFAARSTYRKVRDRASYAFALVSVAAALELSKAAQSRDVRLALGGVAHKPWRAREAEAALRGAAGRRGASGAAAEAELAGAAPLATTPSRSSSPSARSSAVLRA